MAETQQLLEGRVAIVTGAASGLGAAIARGMVAAGASVVLTDINGPGVEAFAASLGHKAIPVQHDVSAAADWVRVTERAHSCFGKIDILVNNAGVALATKPLEDVEESEFRRIIEINQIGVWLGMKHVLPSMYDKGRGNIINVASVAGKAPDEFTLAYASSKAAVIAMTKAAAREVGHRGIRVNSLVPGVIETPLFQEMRPLMEEYANRLVAATPMGRLGQPEEVAALTVFLASDHASFVTGSASVIDGGMTC